jgi:hypothetical protein
MASEHSPGPWREHDPHPTGARFIVGPIDKDSGREGPIATAWPLRDGVAPAANGRLIAAAPELLEALKAVLEDAYDMCEGNASRQMIDARALIARIEDPTASSNPPDAPVSGSEGV